MVLHHNAIIQCRAGNNARYTIDVLYMRRYRYKFICILQTEQTNRDLVIQLASRDAELLAWRVNWRTATASQID